MSIESTHSPESAIRSQPNDNGSADLSHKLLSETKFHYDPSQPQVPAEKDGAVNKMLAGFTISDGKDPAPQTAADATFDKNFNTAFLGQLNGDADLKYPKATDANQEQHKAFMFNMLGNAITADSQ
jgi:hypothetical protein